MKHLENPMLKPKVLMHFTKMHGIGNDYIYFDCTKGLPSHPDELSRLLSDRHKSIGGDGIILVCSSSEADFKMRIFNADGSEAQMCGNGSRCVGKFVYDRGLTRKTSLTLETLSGVKSLTLHPGADGKIDSAVVDMGSACLEPELIPVNAPSYRDIRLSACGREVEVTAVSMGNPHGVIFVDQVNNLFPGQNPVGVDTATVHTLGPELENNPAWPERANIEFARVTAPGEIEMRVWERGSGETMACGTGACATAVAAWQLGLADPEKPVVIHLLGGDLEISLSEQGHVMMSGPVATAFTGEVEVPAELVN